MPVGDRYHDDREFRPLALMDSDGVGRHYLVEVREGIFYLSPVKFDTYLVVVIVDKRYEAYTGSANQVNPHFSVWLSGC